MRQFFLFLGLLLLISSCTPQKESKREKEKKVSQEIVAKIEEKERVIKELRERLGKAEEETEKFKEKIKELTNRLSSLQTRFNSISDEWEHRYYQQELVLAIFQIYNYVQQEGELPPDLTPIIVEKDKWKYTRNSDTNFTLQSLIYPEIKYTGSISKVERILRPPGEWRYVGKIVFEEEKVAMILNSKTGETRFVKKGDWVETFRVEKVEDEGIYLISPRGKSVIPYEGGAGISPE